MKLLTDLYSISSPTRKEQDMIRFITNRLKRMSVSYHVDKQGNIYATKGCAETYPCIVAHTDEVHSKRSKSFKVINFRDAIVFGFDSHKKQFQGIGADDKNGIWICLKCLKEYEHLKCVFFMGEEQGCIGSHAADISFFNDCRFVLQCDRKGNCDFITSVSGIELCSSKFIKDVNLGAHRYKVNSGLPTDVSTLKQRGLSVSCVNISCGYYNPHTNEEYTRIVDLKKCLRFVKHIVENCTDVYVHQYRPYKSWFDRYDNLNRYRRFQNESIDDCVIYTDYNRQSSESFPIRQYDSLVNVMSNRLAFDNTLTVDDLMDIFRHRFPHAKRQHYESAYAEIKE